MNKFDIDLTIYLFERDLSSKTRRGKECELERVGKFCHSSSFAHIPFFYSKAWKSAASTTSNTVYRSETYCIPLVESEDQRTFL